jgi:hypothetical protein
MLIPIKVPKIGTTHLSKIFPIIDKVQGGIETYRWGRNSKKELEQISLHMESFEKFGLLIAFVVIKVPTEYVAKLDGLDHVYSKGDYVTIDANGRLRTLKRNVNHGVYLLDGEVPIVDCTESILGDATEITDEHIEKLWEAVVALSTGNLDLTIYQFINSAAEVITDPKRKDMFVYFRDVLRKFSGNKVPKVNKLTNSNVMAALMSRMPTEQELRAKTFPYEMDRKRYTNYALTKVRQLREYLGRGEFPSTFVNYLFEKINEAIDDGNFTSCDWVHDDKTNIWIRQNHTESGRYSMRDSKTGIQYNLYTDEHYFAFEEALDEVMAAILQEVPNPGGYQNDFDGKRRGVEMAIHHYETKKVVKDYMGI